MNTKKILLAATAIAIGLVGVVHAAPLRFDGTECVEPPPLHCPEKDCPAAVVTNQGSVVEATLRQLAAKLFSVNGLR
jgi:hypothetical protein